LEDSISANTPRAKKLVDKEFLKILEKFEQGDVRELIKKVRKIVGTGRPERLEILKEGLNKKDLKVLNPLLNTKIFNRSYLVGCKECKTDEAPSWFTTLKEAEDYLKKSNFKCFICNKKEREIVLGYKLSPDTELAIGFWLEYIIYKKVKSETEDVYFSTYFGTMESDVLFILGENLILISCKDTSIGNTDLYSLHSLSKKQGADKIFVICPEKQNKDFKQDEHVKEIIIIKFKTKEDLIKKFDVWIMEFKKEILLKTIKSYVFD